MIPINQSGAVTPLIYTHVTMLQQCYLWILFQKLGSSMPGWHMIFAGEEKDLVHLISELIGGISTF